MLSLLEPGFDPWLGSRESHKPHGVGGWGKVLRNTWILVQRTGWLKVER